MPVGPGSMRCARRLAGLLLVAAVLSACGAKPAGSASNAAPPVSVKAMPPIPDLSTVRTFTSPIPGLPTNKAGITAASLQQLGDLKYPEAAWTSGLQGWAVYDFVVAPDGSVSQRHVRLVKASEVPRFDSVPTSQTPSAETRRRGGVIWGAARRAWLARYGVAVRAVMTENGPGYRSRHFSGLRQQLRVRHVRDSPVLAADQWGGGAPFPDGARGMGLCPAVQDLTGTCECAGRPSPRPPHRAPTQRSGIPYANSARQLSGSLND